MSSASRCSGAKRVNSIRPDLGSKEESLREYIFNINKMEVGVGVSELEINVDEEEEES
jgi:hypothetical protein